MLTNTVTGFLAKIFGNTLPTQTLPGYPMNHSSPIPYVRDVVDYLPKICFDPRIHRYFDEYSFQTTLIFCNTMHSAENHVQLQLCSYIPFVRIPVEFQVASYIKYPFPSCALKNLSYYSNSFAEMVGSATELPIPHYFAEMDFTSAEELDWQRTPGYYGVEYLSKEGQRKENQKDRTSMKRYQRRAENQDRHLMGLLPLRRKAGTHNRKHRQRPQRLGTISRFDASLPNGQNTFADLFCLLSML